MIFSDTIIENKRFFLRNLVINASSSWSTASSSYGMFRVNYEFPLGLNKIYYVGYTYKFITTNQSPTWVNFYAQAGYYAWDTANLQISNPAAGTEYKKTGLGHPAQVGNYTLMYGAIYNGASNAIAGISAQAKNVFVYDITELYALLLSRNIVTNYTTMKTWCDNNLTYQNPNKNFEITKLIQSALNKVSIQKGNIVTDNYIEPDGMKIYSVSDTLRNNTYFDTGIGFGVYNNSSNGAVTHNRINAKDQNSPFYPQHQYICKITTNGTAKPGAGGFHASHTAAANKIFVEKFVAKIPIGYTVEWATNAQGSDASIKFLSSQNGTGEWEEYTILYKCGSSGSFSTGGHVYITGSDDTNVTWYVAYVNNCDITGNEYLKNYSVLGNVDRINSGTLFSRQFDNLNLLLNGNGANQNVALPSGWIYDTTDVAGNAIASIVQPVNAAAGTILPWILINPSRKYKISYWVKCKQDMTSFLTGIRIKCGNTEVTHGDVNYKSGTKTQLTKELKSGDTSLTVKSNVNWAETSHSLLGFRSFAYKSYNDKGTSNGNSTAGLISEISGTTIINLKIAYSGATQPINTYVCECYSGSTYPYPINKAQLPTDNTWKYVEGYFGGEGGVLWDGNNAEGAWAYLPADATEIALYLNLYRNNGTVPIKFSDIRIEPISTESLNRLEQKIQIKGGM